MISNIITALILIPARIKGMKLGKNTIIGPGYDFMGIRLKGVSIGNDVVISRNAQIGLIGDDKNNQIKIGDDTEIGRNFVCMSHKGVKIGKKCMISYNVSVLDYEHDFYNPNISPVDAGLSKSDEIVIEDDCFIGSHSFIMKGVKLGKHCVVSANSVVTNSFPAFSVVAGNPAKLIKVIR